MTCVTITSDYGEMGNPDLEDHNPSANKSQLRMLKKSGIYIHSGFPKRHLGLRGSTGITGAYFRYIFFRVCKRHNACHVCYCSRQASATHFIVSFSAKASLNVLAGLLDHRHRLLYSFAWEADQRSLREGNSILLLLVHTRPFNGMRLYDTNVVSTLLPENPLHQGVCKNLKQRCIHVPS